MKKKRRKPTRDQSYWSISSAIEIGCFYWLNDGLDKRRWKAHNVFLSKKGAEQMLAKVQKVFKEGV